MPSRISPKSDDADKREPRGRSVEPLGYAGVWLRSDELGDNVRVDKKSVHRSIWPGIVFLSFQHQARITQRRFQKELAETLLRLARRRGRLFAGS